MEFRQRFHRDVFIDLLCYRKYGHNEGDEPRFTQPLLYKAIAAHPNPREIYFQKLLAEKAVDADTAKNIDKDFKAMLQDRLDESKQIRKTKLTSFLEGTWKGIRQTTDADFEVSPNTGFDKTNLLEIATKISTLPAEKKFFNKTDKLFKDRLAMIANNSYDWAMGELLAYSTLLLEGKAVRVSGQDVERGTFSHRHAVVKLEDSEEEYIPLDNLSTTQAKFSIYNSHLSEYGVLGFEYGYAMARPNALTIWEAQFGDFNNGAQIIIDQYLSSAEDKWRRMNGICLFLPHGYEGQGSEHSSARIERFLVLCAENNMYVINPTTPANFFHALRRQIVNEFRKPLIAFTPKSLLRHPKCVSTIEDFSNNKFTEVIDDAKADSKAVKRLVFCSGKVYYDLLEKQQSTNDKNVAIIRIEQYYPIPSKQIQTILDKYKNAKDNFWVQEEPENMGAWPYVNRKFKIKDLNVIARPESASPATGSSKMHAKQQLEIIEKTFQF
jgi:2-oxoglutarate dehydrogenase E1 component